MSEQDAKHSTQDLTNINGVSVLNQYRRNLENLLSSTSKTNHKTITMFLEYELAKKGLSALVFYIVR